MQIRRIEKVHAIPGTLTLVVQWQDGVEDAVDMTSIIQRSAPLRHLEAPDLFSDVEVIDWGCAIGWRGDLGYGADTLHEQIHQQHMKAAG
ncbi:MAG: DUF2442 domain-containing protein [Magnetococcales bacterium]|nr:DUF2442 domain-containing protein [Magnetococcales bacterium]